MPESTVEDYETTPYARFDCSRCNRTTTNEDEMAAHILAGQCENGAQYYTRKEA